MRTESIHEKHNHLMESRDTHKNHNSAKQKNPLSEKADVEAGILVHTHTCHYHSGGLDSG